MLRGYLFKIEKFGFGWNSFLMHDLYYYFNRKFSDTNVFILKKNKKKVSFTLS